VENCLRDVLSSPTPPYSPCSNSSRSQEEFSKKQMSVLEEYTCLGEYLDCEAESVTRLFCIELEIADGVF
jgi:hypothetical protein